MYPDYFLSIPEFEGIMDYILKEFLEREDYAPSKILTMFLSSLFEKNDQLFNPVLLKLLPKVIEVIFAKILTLKSIPTVTKLFAHVLKGFQDQKEQIMEVFLNAMNAPVFQKVEYKQKTIVFEALFFNRASPKTLVNIMTHFQEFVSAEKLLAGAMIAIEATLVPMFQGGRGGTF